MVKKLFVLVLLVLLAFTASAQSNTATALPSPETSCPELVYPTDAVVETLSGTDNILAELGADTDGPFRGLGGENPLINYRSEELEVVTDDESNLVMEPDWGGANGRFKHSAIKFVAPNGTWFIVAPKGRQNENLPAKAFTVAPGGIVCWDRQGGHLWAYAGATPEQLVNELGLYFGPFSEEELDAELTRLKSEVTRLNSVMTLDIPAADTSEGQTYPYISSDGQGNLVIYDLGRSSRATPTPTASTLLTCVAWVCFPNADGTLTCTQCAQWAQAGG